MASVIPYRKVNITRMNRNTWMLLFHNCTQAEVKIIMDRVAADDSIANLDLDYISSAQQLTASSIKVIQAVVLQSPVTTIPPIVKKLIYDSVNVAISEDYAAAGSSSAEPT